MGMAVSLEARTPFLDFRVVEAAFRMPGSYKLRQAETKVILKSAFRQLLGDSLVNCPKRMFTVPIGDWFREPEANQVLSMVTGERFGQRKIAEPMVVSDMISAHRSGRSNFTREIRALVALELWFRIFIDEQRSTAPVWADLAD